MYDKSSWGCVAEAIFFLFKTGQSILDPTVRLYLYRSVCLEAFKNDSTCLHLRQHPNREEYVQSISASYIMYYKILLNGPAILLGLFCGAWSDKIGRKLPVMFPCLGTILSTLIYMVSMIRPEPTVIFILLGGLLNGIFGKSAVITMALHSYVSDTSSKENRTAKLGKLLAMNFFGFFFGSLLAGFLLDLIGFNITFMLVVLLNFFAFLLALFCMGEREVVNNNALEKGSDDTNKEISRTNFLFDFRNVQESLSVIFKPRQDNLRCYIIILFMTLIVQQTCKSGEVDVLLLFVEKSPLSWKKSTYAYLLATDYGCMGISVMVILPLLSCFCGVNDVIIILIGIAFKLLRTISLSLSDKTWMVFMSAVLGAPSSMMVGGAKSLISKSVSEDEMGKTFSLLSCCETVSNLIGSVVFTNIYAATFVYFEGMTFLVETFIFMLLLVVILMMAKEMQSNSRYQLVRDVTASSDELESKDPDQAKQDLQ